MKNVKTKLKSELHSAAKKKQWWKFLLIVLILVGIYIYTNAPSDSGAAVYDDGTFSTDVSTQLVVHFIDVGQADAVYIELPTGEHMLIDAGMNASEDQLIAYLDKYNADVIDYAVFTHPHEDHIGGADKVLDRYEVKNVILPDAEANTATYENMLDGILASGANTILAEAGDTYTVGEAAFRILGPIEPSSDDLNNASIILHLTWGDTSFLFTGDAEAQSESAVLNTLGASAVNADVLKVGHHGSSTSSSEAFLDAVSPSAAIISCGENNDYGHPHDEVVERLTARNVPIFRTDELGSIRVYSDGTALLVKSDRKSGES